MRIQTTRYYDDFCGYYERARTLNLRNIGDLPSSTTVGDELQDNVTIYDTVWRRYAGFSKVLEQLWYGPESWTKRKSLVAYKDCLTVEEWLYVCLVHRLTGSGASFEKDHGYRNTAVIEMVESSDSTNYNDRMEHFKYFLADYDKPMFTSKGNQIPPFNKPNPEWYYDKGGREFLCEHAPKLAKYARDLFLKASQTYHTFSITEMVDLVLEWMEANGFKKYRFVLTAWVMDMAEYYPEYVDQDSDVYIGKNCARSLDFMYVKPVVMNKKEFYTTAMRQLCEDLDNKPYNMEDVLCDSIRYWANYIPKGYKGHYTNNLCTVERINLN